MSPEQYKSICASLYSIDVWSHQLKHLAYNFKETGNSHVSDKIESISNAIDTAKSEIRDIMTSIVNDHLQEFLSQKPEEKEPK